MIFIDPNRTVEYVLKEQRPQWKCCNELTEDSHAATCTVRGEETMELPTEQVVRFSLRVFSARRWAEVTGELAQVAKRELRDVTVQDTNNSLLRIGCTGWTAPEGMPKHELDKRGFLSWKTIDCLPLPTRAELADAIWGMNVITEPTKGFSPQP